MLGTSCYALAPDARALLFTWRRFGRQHTRCVEDGLRISKKKKKEYDYIATRRKYFLEIWAMFIQRVVCDSFWGRMAAVWATTYKVCVEDGLRIPENSRRDDDSDPKEIFFVF